MERFSDYQYLSRLNATSEVRNRVTAILSAYQALHPEIAASIEDVFICNAVNVEGANIFENLWFFTPNYMMEAKNFMHEFNIDICPIGPVARIEFQYKDYDFTRATDDSRLNVEFSFVRFGVSGVLKASRANCDELLRVYRKYIKPRIVTYSGL